MAFDPLEERRKGQRGMLDLFGSSPLSGGGMLSAAGMPPMRRAMPPVDYGSPEYWAMPSSERPNFFGTQNIYSPPSSAGMLDPIEPQKSEAWWAAQPRPSFVPADWVYIGMGDWGPPDAQLLPGAEYGPDISALPPLPGGMPFIPPSDAS